MIPDKEAHKKLDSIDRRLDAIQVDIDALHEDVKTLLKEEGETLFDDLPDLPSPPENKCESCGHQREDHLPLASKGCFSEGCKCKGWKFK